MPFQRKSWIITNEGESQVLPSMLERADYLPTTTWSGLEALELLKAREFDIALVSSYLSDLYVGDFFERFEHLAVRPCVIVMQEGQAAVLLKSGAQR